MTNALLNAANAISTAPTTGGTPAVLRCACGNIAEPRDAHVDALRCKSCWSRFAAPASPAASVLSDDLRDSVLSALDDLKLVIDGTMGAVGLETTFVSLVEALEADRAVDSDWRCRRNNAFDRFALLAASMGGDRK